MADLSKIYDWGMGDDNAALEVLTALNSIINSLYVLDNHSNTAKGLVQNSSLNLPLTFAGLADEIRIDDEFNEIAAEFEKLRAVLFAEKFDWNIVEQMLKERKKGK